jgi:hypothetical protein
MEHFNEKMKTGGVKALFKDLNKERHPEAMDVGLHVDDFATVGALAGLGWVEPVLLALYTLSGFRAGMGYRNGHGHKASQAPSSAESQTVQPVAAQVTAAQQPVTPQPAMQHSSLMPHPLGHPSVALQPAPHQPVAYASITMQPVPLHARPQSPFALMGSGYPAESAAVS